MVWQSWLIEHWFDLIQTVGIFGGLLFTGFALNADAKAKRAGNLLSITQQHRELWMELFTEPELFRILRADADLAKKPLTDKEERFVRFLILHLYASYRAIKSGVLDEPSGLKPDIKTFFALPIPQAVWQGMRELCNADFVSFVEAIKKNPS
jgi:hypothetical protein